MAGSKMAGGTALISGATGVVGARIVADLAARDDWRIIGLSRRLPMEGERATGVDYLSLDLTDRACADVIGRSSGIIHFFNASRYDHTTTQPEPADINTQMFLNLLDPLEQAGHPLAACPYRAGHEILRINGRPLSDAGTGERPAFPP